jgi:DNA repair protein RadC
MNNEAVETMRILLGGRNCPKSLAECAVAYLARCRELPTAEEVVSALRVSNGMAEKIVASARMSFMFLLDTMPIKVGNPGLVAAYLSDLKNARTEHVVVLTVASDNTLIKRHECAAGSASRASVDPGAVYQLAIADGARSVIIAHNHPSGSARFSDGDYEFTEQLIESGRIVGIRLLDSIVISNRGVVSMRAEKPEMFVL